MARYFIEVAYKGTNYSGFQVQKNANSIQGEVEKAFQTIHRKPVQLTGSSRTDAGVHALQNFFHFDFDDEVHTKAVYKMNAVLPFDISIKNLFLMPDTAHSRFDAISRKYTYRVHKNKSPFLTDTSLFYPYPLDMNAMKEGADFIKSQTNFFPFSKSNTQVKNFNCTIYKSEWSFEEDTYHYTIEANRFLRGMVRLITATLLQIGRKHYGLDEVRNLCGNNERGKYSLPPHGLYLDKVNYTKNYFLSPAVHLDFY